MRERTGTGARASAARWRWGAMLLLLAGLAGCAVPFGPEPDPGAPRRSAIERNRLFLEEQERLERQRQSFETIRPSDR